jgi:hypothetical protein
MNPSSAVAIVMVTITGAVVAVATGSFIPFLCSMAGLAVILTDH